MYTFLTKLIKLILWSFVKTFSIFYCIVLTPLMIFYTLMELSSHGIHDIDKSRSRDVDDDLQNEIFAKFSIIFCVDMIDALTDRLAWWKEADTDGHDI